MAYKVKLSNEEYALLRNLVHLEATSRTGRYYNKEEWGLLQELNKSFDDFKAANAAITETRIH